MEHFLFTLKVLVAIVLPTIVPLLLDSLLRRVPREVPEQPSATKATKSTLGER